MPSKKNVASKRKVPAYSQFLDVTLENWQHRACGIVALASVMEFLGAETPSMVALIKFGLSKKAYEDGVGWKHESLAEIAEHYKLRAAAYDWLRNDPVSALRKLKWAVRLAPCLASIHKDFNSKNDGGHLIVITRISGYHVFYHEPASRVRREIRRKIDIDTFLAGWKRRGVIVRKQ